MNTLLIIFGQISLGLLEIIIFQLGAIILGFSIHFFISNRKSLTNAPAPVEEYAGISNFDEWQLKYLDQLDLHEKMNEKMTRELNASKENEHILSQEVDDLRKELKRIVETPPEPTIQIAPEQYLAQLTSAQENLSDHNHRLDRLLVQIDQLKESERKHHDTLLLNESLNNQLREVRHLLSEKETEIREIRQHQDLTNEMKGRLNKAYEEFNSLQGKLQKLESYIARPNTRSFEYEELQQNYFKLTKEFDEIKGKQIAMMEENQRLSRILSDTEDKLRESNFQRQQLTKKVTFLDELNQDLQQVSTQNKKLENQLRRLGEIEALLARVSGKKEN